MSLPPRDEIMVKALGELFVHEFEKPLLRRICQLEKRIEELEEGGLRYAGIFQRSVSYRRGTACTFDGSLWIAVVDTKPNQVPGSGDGTWQLAVKSPRAPTTPRSQARP